MRSKLTLTLLILLAGPAIAATAEKGHAFYRVTFDKDSPSTIRVHAEVPGHEGLIKMLPWGHPWLPHGWATFVEDLTMHGEDGSEIDTRLVEEDGWGSWTVGAENGERLTLDYIVELTHHEHDWGRAGGRDARPEIKDGALFLVSRAIFIYSLAVETATVEFVVPSGWSLTTPWPAIDPMQPHVVQVDSLTSLHSNVLVTGVYQERVIQDGSMMIKIAVDPELEEHADSFEKVFTTQLGGFRRLFGSTPETIYVVGLRVAGENDGESFNSSFSQVFLDDQLDRDFIVWANTLSHELFHFFNGANGIMADDKEAFEWFGEGFTEYYSSLTLMREGLISEALWFKKLESYFSRYMVTKRMWPIEQVSFMEAGRDKGKNWLLIYGGGASLALYLDIEIRSLTHGARGLDDVMRLLKERFTDTDRLYRLPDLIATVSEVAGTDLAWIFDDFVVGTDAYMELPLQLEKAGLHLATFADEFYIRKISEPSKGQTAVLSGLVTAP